MQWNLDRNNTSFAKEVAEYFEANKEPIIKQMRFHQNIVLRYFEKYNARGLLIYHKMGLGKSMLAAAICDYLGTDVLFISAKSLHSNFEHTMKAYQGIKRGNPGQKIFRGEVKFISLNASNMFEQVNRALQTDLEQFLNSNVKMRSSLDKKTVVVDEAHNLFNAIVNGSQNAVKLYRAITKSDCKVIFLTGSPLTNDPFELVPCFNMISGMNLFPEDYFEFTDYFTSESSIKNLSKFANRINGLVSYYAGTESVGTQVGMPEEKPLKEVVVTMSKYQYSLYAEAHKKEVELMLKQNNFKKAQALTKPKTGGSFRVMTRQLSNFAYPEYAQEKGRDEKGNTVYETIFEKLDATDIGKNIGIYSPKIQAIYENLQQDGIGLVYSQFIKYGLGILALYLTFKGWKEYDGTNDEVLGKNVFAVLSGEIKYENADKILARLNSNDNKFGDKIKVILVSSTAAEGVDFKNLRHIHITEPYWNISRIRQIIGRGVRFNSHKNLPEDQQNVQPYIYLSDHGIKDSTEQTTDFYIYEKAKKNSIILDEFLSVLRRHAIDCSAHYSDCEVCPATNKKLFEVDFYMDKDLPDPCSNSQVKAHIFEHEGETYARYEIAGETQYAKLVNGVYTKVSDEMRDILISLGL